MMPTSPDEIAQLVEDLRTGVSDDPTLAQCRTASEGMRLAAELVSEREVLIDALERYQSLFFGRLGNLEHMGTDEFRAAHAKAFMHAADVLKGVGAAKKDRAMDDHTNRTRVNALLERMVLDSYEENRIAAANEISGILDTTRERDISLAAHFVRHAALAALVQECLDGVVGDCTEWNDRARKLLAGES